MPLAFASSVRQHLIGGVRHRRASFDLLGVGVELWEWDKQAERLCDRKDKLVTGGLIVALDSLSFNGWERLVG